VFEDGLNIVRQNLRRWRFDLNLTVLAPAPPNATDGDSRLDEWLEFHCPGGGENADLNELDESAPVVATTGRKAQASTKGGQTPGHVAT
jgi:hypothetical protein